MRRENQGSTAAVGITLIAIHSAAALLPTTVFGWFAEETDCPCGLRILIKICPIIVNVKADVDWSVLDEKVYYLNMSELWLRFSHI